MHNFTYSIVFVKGRVLYSFNEVFLRIKQLIQVLKNSQPKTYIYSLDLLLFTFLFCIK